MLRLLLVFAATLAIAAEPPIPDDVRTEMLGRFAKERARLDAALAKLPPADKRGELSAAEQARVTAEEIKLLTQRGAMKEFLADFKGAVVDFEKEIALDPKRDAPHWQLGIAYYLAGDFAKSAKQFEKHHTVNSTDRENGIWHFMANARVKGVEAARKEMIEYKEFDREPFPSLYEMFAGKKTGAEIFEEIKTKKLTEDIEVNFFAQYYVGVNEELLGHKDAAREHLAKAVALSRVANTGGGPGYMGQAARLQYEQLK